MKKLLARVHGVFFWMNIPVSIDVDLIVKITNLPTDGVNPEKYLYDKKKQKAIAEEVKDQFGTDKGSRGMIIKSINDPSKIFMTNMISCKLLRKFCMEKAPARMVAIVTQCAMGAILSWAPYFLNLFLEDFIDAQDSGMKFHCLWLLILIALVAWEETKYSTFLYRRGKCCATRYISLWHNRYPK
jgi:hypothetical protein